MSASATPDPFLAIKVSDAAMLGFLDPGSPRMGPDFAQHAADLMVERGGVPYGVARVEGLRSAYLFPDGSIAAIYGDGIRCAKSTDYALSDVGGRLIGFYDPEDLQQALDLASDHVAAGGIDPDIMMDDDDFELPHTYEEAKALRTHMQERLKAMHDELGVEPTEVDTETLAFLEQLVVTQELLDPARRGPKLNIAESTDKPEEDPSEPSSPKEDPPSPM